MIRKLLDSLRAMRRLRRMKDHGAYRPGHYHSPIPTREEVTAYVAADGDDPCNLPEIRLDAADQLARLRKFQAFYRELPFPEQPAAPCRYYYDQTWFSYADAIFLYSFLREAQPRRIIEVGSGFSSAVMLDTVERFFDEPPTLTCIDPNPGRLRRLLKPEDAGRTRIIQANVQDVPLDTFGCLAAGDFLFIDSSHVVKCGSDVQFLMFRVLPRLPAGVFVHFHDVFYPFEYPPEWLLQGRYWNEAYFLRAFLAYNSAWKIHFFTTYVAHTFRDFLAEHMPLCLRNTGASLYLQSRHRRKTTGQRSHDRNETMSAKPIRDMVIEPRAGNAAETMRR